MSNATTDQPVYLGGPVSTVPDAIERLETITSYIDEREPRKTDDGVQCFNHLYTVITKRVLEGIQSGFFVDQEFLSVLDVAFANRYLDALRFGLTQPSVMPKSWKILVEKRNDERVESIQFAIAGVNAHINLDLAVSLLITCEQMGTELNDGSHHDDYLKINQIFAEEMTSLRQYFESNVVREVDGVAAPVLDIISNFSVEVARDAAWEVAEHLETIEKFGIKRGPFVNRLDRLTALAGNLLLTPLHF